MKGYKNYIKSDLVAYVAPRCPLEIPKPQLCRYSGKVWLMQVAEAQGVVGDLKPSFSRWKQRDD